MSHLSIVEESGAGQAFAGLAVREGFATPTLNTIRAATASPTAGVPPALIVPLGTPLSVAARELILSTLEHCNGERKRTAEMLGICTKTLYNRLREYGIRDVRRAGTGNAS